MKKLYLSLLLVSIGVAANAQRSVRVTTAINLPTLDLNIKAGDKVSPDYTIKNEGPDPIIVGDTIFVADPRLPIGGKIPFFYTADIPAGSSINLNKIVLGATWDVYFDTSGSSSTPNQLLTLYKKDITKGKESYRFKDNTQYNWFLEVTNVVPQNGKGTIVFDNSGAKATQEVWINQWPASIGELFGNRFESIKTYPNPASNQLSFDYTFPGNNDAKVTIFDASGRIALTKEIENAGTGNQKISLDITTLQSGLYFLNLAVDGKFIRSQFAVQK